MKSNPSLCLFPLIMTIESKTSKITEAWENYLDYREMVTNDKPSVVEQLEVAEALCRQHVRTMFEGTILGLSRAFQADYLKEFWTLKADLAKLKILEAQQEERTLRLFVEFLASVVAEHGPKVKVAINSESTDYELNFD
jgi:hypothetical protein